MDLSNNTPENVDYMVEKIKEKLRMMNIGAVRAEHFNSEMYEELHEIYMMVMKKIPSAQARCKQSLQNSAP